MSASYHKERTRAYGRIWCVETLALQLSSMHIPKKKKLIFHSSMRPICLENFCRHIIIYMYATLWNKHQLNKSLRSWWNLFFNWRFNFIFTSTIEEMLFSMIYIDIWPLQFNLLLLGVHKIKYYVYFIIVSAKGTFSSIRKHDTKVQTPPNSCFRECAYHI